jgi:hypothetical protein
MPDQQNQNELSELDRKERRANANRENAKKSTGPKTPAGKAKSRANSLIHGECAVVLDQSAKPGLALLSGEDPQEYRDLLAEFMETLAPRTNVEVIIVQRIINAQWRLLRNSRMQTMEFEAALVIMRDVEHPGLPDAMIGDIDCVGATRMTIGPNEPIAQLQKEEARQLRVISASLRELSQVRKLNPLPDAPMRPKRVFPAPNLGPLESTYAPVAPAPAEPEVIENTEETPAGPTERSQLQFIRIHRPERPKPIKSINEPEPPRTSERSLAAASAG